MLNLRQALLERINIAQKCDDRLRSSLDIFDKPTKFDNAMDGLADKAEKARDTGRGAEGFHQDKAIGG